MTGSRVALSRRHFLKVVGTATGAAALGGLLGACSSAPASAPKPAATAQSTQAPATGGKQIVVRIASVVAPGGAVEKSCNDFAKYVSEKTNGEVTTQNFLGGQLGGERDMVESVQLGSIEVGYFGSYAMGNITPEWGLVIDTPYVMRDQEHFRKVVDGPLSKPMYDAMLERKGVRHIAWANRGPRYLTSNKPISEPADLKGVKIRVPEVETYMAAWKMLGATVTPMAFPELFMALKQGTVEAQENPFELIYTSSFYEVQKYLNLTAHIRGAYELTISEKWFKGLNADLQKVVTDGLVFLAAQEDKYQAADETDLEKKLKEKGMTFNPVQLDKFRDALKDLPKQFASKWKPGFYEEILAVK